MPDTRVFRALHFPHRRREVVSNANPTPKNVQPGEMLYDEAANKLYAGLEDTTAVQIGGGGAGSLVTAASVSAFPATGAASNLYITTEDQRLWRWDSTASIYVESGPIGGGGGGGSGITDGDKGDITVSGSGATWAINTGTIITTDLADGAVTDAKVTSITAAKVTGLPTAGTGSTNYCAGNDSRLSDAREWSAATATQAEAEAGSSTSRLAFTPLRVFQAIAAWWAASSAKTKLDGIATGATANSSDATLLARANHTGTQAAGTITGLATVATSGGYGDLSGRPTLGTAAAAATGDFAAASHNQAWSTITATPTSVSGYGITDAGPSAVAWVVNRYVSPLNATVGSGGALAANTIYLMPFVAPRSFSFSELGARINTAAASSNFQLAIYGSSSSLLPTGTAIASTASLSGASATALSGSATGSLTGGVLYWMACNQDSASLVYQSLVASSLLQTFTTGASTLAIATNGNSSATSFRTISSTFGTWPDLTSATTTETSGTQRAALIYMRVGALT